MAKRIPIANDEIVRVYVETRSVRRTAQQLGMTESTINKRLQQSGVERNAPRGVARKLPPTITEEYLSGSSMNEIARRYGACLATVAEALRRAGIDSRRRGGIRKQLTDEITAKVIALYDELKSQREVGLRLGVSQSMVSRHMASVGRNPRAHFAGPGHASWKGGRIKTGDAGKKYWAVYVSDADEMSSMRPGQSRYVMEHRLVVAHWLGRPLERHETVHHINGNTEDNRLENLQLRSTLHGAGVAHRCRVCGSTDIESVKLN
jgi:transposase-like protein